MGRNGPGPQRPPAQTMTAVIRLGTVWTAGPAVSAADSLSFQLT